MKATTVKRKLVNQYIQRFPNEAAIILNRANEIDVLSYLQQQPLDAMEGILLHLSPDVLARVINVMEDKFFVEIFESLHAYPAAKFISRLAPETRDTKLLLLNKKKAAAIGELLAYPPESAGYLMDTRILTFNPHNTVDEVLIKLRTLGDRKLMNLYITEPSGKLRGKVFIQTIAISPVDTVLEELIEPCVSVQVMSPAEEVVEIFETGKNINLPVVDMENNLLGIIRNEALVAATQKDASQDVMAMFGAGREERALSSPWLAVRKRLPWLEINLATAFLAASIVGIFEETIAQVTVLAVFLPVVAGQSGNTGSQALAVTMRGLALREIQVRHWWRVARKEALVGFVNGIAVALTTSLIVFFWASSLGLALVIGSSMILSMVIAGFSGAVVPIVLKAVGQDPAQSSSIVLTTITDIVGFFSFLGLTTLLGSALGIL